MSDDRPVLLFGETYHHPNILYRTGFLVPDPVVVVDRGGSDTVLWVSALEEGRARKEASVGAVRSTMELEIPAPRAGGNEYVGWADLVTAVCREHGLNAVDVDAEFPTVLADHLRQNDVDVRPRTDIYQQRRRIKSAEEIEWITATENAGMAALQKAIDVIAAAEIRDGLLVRDGRNLSSADLIFAVESHLLENGNSTVDFDLLRRPRVRRTRIGRRARSYVRGCRSCSTSTRSTSAPGTGAT